MQVAGSPSFVDDQIPVTPVSIVGGNIGLPKPRANQRTRYAYRIALHADTYYQIATNSSTKQYYYVGVIASCSAAAVAHTDFVFDAASGNTPASDTDEIMLYERNFIANSGDTAVLPIPLKMTNGIRLRLGDAGAAMNAWAIVVYIEEDI